MPHSAEFLRSIVESAVDGIIFIDAQGTVLAFNPGAERLFGYAAAEVLGKNVRMLMPSPDREQHDGYLANYFRTGVPKIIGKGREVRGLRRNGQTFPLHLSVGATTIDGKPGFTGILHDLTDRVEVEDALRRSEERLRSIVESAVDGIIVINELGSIRAANQSVERLFGYRADELIGQNVKMLMPNPDRDLHDGYLHSYVTTGVRKIIGIGREVAGLRKDGTTFPLHLSVGEMMTPEGRAFTGILHDLSDRVQLEQRLAEQKALATLGEMAAVVAHEVKNPIAGIRGALQVITSRMPQEQREKAILLDIISRLDGLNRIVVDMLMFARPRSLKHEPIALRMLLDETVSMISRDPNMSALSVHVRGDAQVNGDREMLQVVLQNIIMNAGQAMEGRGRIDVSVSLVNGEHRIAVADHGPGMPEETRARAFDAFFTTKHRGTGLGLAIARRVAEGHGGRIEIDVPTEGGTIVTVVLP